MKITFWWRQASGYFDACTRALVDAGHRVSVIYQSPTDCAPFTSLVESGFTHLDTMSTWNRRPADAVLESSIMEEPDVLVVASWGVWQYVRHSQKAPKRTLRLLGMDSPWRASPRQIVGQFSHRRALRRAFDGAWVTGTQQRVLANRLGFPTWQILDHLYCCDSNLFAAKNTPEDRYGGPFLFVGRLVAKKGILELAQAYQSLRSMTGTQRPLKVVGRGLIPILGDGIEVSDFLDPSQLRDQMDNAYILVHPAHLEHWGVVVHEAASMGLPMILGPRVYAGSRYLSSGRNGLYAGPSVSELTQALLYMDQLPFSTYAKMSSASHQLSHVLDLSSWVDNFEEGVRRLIRQRG
jgi:glycosyltransferase involved in cell wall biosynthesis